MNNYFLNTKKYDKKAKRLAIFGKEVIKGEVEMFMLRCSKEDKFYKRVAKQIYEYYLEYGLEKMNKLFPEYHPIIQNVVIEKGNTASDIGLQSGDRLFIPRSFWADAGQYGIILSGLAVLTTLLVVVLGN